MDVITIVSKLTFFMVFRVVVGPASLAGPRGDPG